MRRGSITPLLLVVAAVLLPARSRGQDADYSHYVSPWKTPWDYEGPKGAEHWGELDPQYAIAPARNSLRSTFGMRIKRNCLPYDSNTGVAR